MEQTISKFNKARQRRKSWHKVVSAMAGVVVFCTVYALILPAITMSTGIYCGMEEHLEHTLEEGCFEDQQVLICTLPEEAHAHTDACYAEQTVTVCGLEATEGHAHTAACYIDQERLNCTLPETAGHIHGDGCYQYLDSLACTLEESEEHTHAAECSVSERVLVCTQPEVEPHTHTAWCYTLDRVLICGQTECEPHTHTELCTEVQKLLVCGQEEREAHIHTELCYELQPVVTCEKPIHVHGLGCYADHTADLETPASWEKTFRDVVLTGDWGRDVIAIARTQLNYMESDKNYIVDDQDNMYGYTRYGAWFGTTYGEWSTTFAAFCIHYAGVPQEQFPLSANANQWAAALENRYVAPAGYTPKIGDLVFFDRDNDAAADRVALVSDLICDESGALVRIETVAGNVTRMVQTMVYERNDPSILGYGSLPVNPEYEEPTEPVDPTDVTTEPDGSFTKTYVAEDYTVTVNYTAEAQIPEYAELIASEYNRQSEAYQTRYAEAAAIYGWDAAYDYSETFRLFNLGFVADAHKVEPAAPVRVEITFRSAEAPDYRVTNFSSVTDKVVRLEGETLTFELALMGDLGIEDLSILPVKPEPVTVTKTFDGPDYTVTVTYSSEAGVPDEAELLVSEYEKNDSTYLSRYVEAARLYNWESGKDYTAEFRLFNIGLFVDGVEVNPTQPVHVEITYHEAAEDVVNYQVTHYGTTTETLDAQSEDGRSVTFDADSFSDFAFLPMKKAPAEKQDQITMIYGAGAGFPEGTELKVTEISQDSEQYRDYLAQVIEAMDLNPDADFTTFFRVFDLSPECNGEKVQPVNPVQIHVVYADRPVTEDHSAVAFHFGDETEQLDVACYPPEEGGFLEFDVSSFSPFGILEATAEEYAEVLANNPVNLLALPAAPEGADLLLELKFDNSGSLTQNTQGVVANLKSDNGKKPQYSTDKAPVSGNVGSMYLAANGKGYMSLEANNNLSLLRGHVVLYFDFWMKQTGWNGTNGWPFIATAESGNISYRNEKYIGFPAQTGTLKAERWNNTGSRDDSTSAQASYNNYTKQWIHVYAEFNDITDQITLTLHDRNGNQIGTQTKTNKANNVDIFTSACYMMIGKANWEGGQYFEGYIDEFKIYGSGDLSHPTGAKTQNRNIDGVFFYNIDTTEEQAKAVSGVVYEITRTDGTLVRTVKSTESFVVDLGRDMESGTYWIRQKQVPKDYFVAEQAQQFTVTAGDSKVCAGTFYLYKNTEYGRDKVAEVRDYAKRIYDVKLTAASKGRQAKVQAANYNFVVDQSNSMLFPARLEEYGKVKFNSDSELEAGYTLDTKKVYYWIENPSTMATNHAVWYNEAAKKWYSMDAAYYAKAQAGKPWDGTKRPTKFADDPSADFDGDDRDSTGGLINEGTYTFYTGSEYDRLTYLLTGLKETVYMLDSIGKANGVKNTVTITGFYNTLAGCTSKDVGIDTGNNVADLIHYCDNIDTQGGTKQEMGLGHILGDDKITGGCQGGHLKTDGTKNITILITDGALNGKNPSTDQKQKFIDNATSIRNHTHREGGRDSVLATLGLSVQHVTLAQQLLSDTNKSYYDNDLKKWVTGQASPGLSFIDQDADQLAIKLAEVILEKTLTWKYHTQNAEMIDYISDSYYLVDENGDALKDGDGIKKNGNKCTNWRHNHSLQDDEGVVFVDNDGTYAVRWSSLTLGNNVQEYEAHVFLKAKEDFVGGNTIDTNKKCTVYMDKVVDGNITVLPEIRAELDTPTVNVHLLPLNQVSSEETVFLQDPVKELEKVQAFVNQIKFQKVTGNTGAAIYNKSDASITEGLDADTFDLTYALGRELNGDEWVTLASGGSVTVPYTYDDASSNGAVGEFTITLVKTGSANLEDHNTTSTGKAVEEYKLVVDYTAYTIGEGENRRPENEHNGTAGPGTEVGGSTAGTTTETGVGTVNSTNTHQLHVVDGRITINKALVGNLVRDEAQHYEFELTRLKADGSDDPSFPPRTVTINLGPKDEKATVTVTNLPKGKYKLVEKANSAMYPPNSVDFEVESAQVNDADDKTNCRTDSSPTTEGKPLFFEIGTYKNGVTVISTTNFDETWPDDGRTRVYTYYQDEYRNRIQLYGDNAGQGVSFGEADIRNRKAGIPVQKAWDQIDESEYENLDVYVALFKKNTEAGTDLPVGVDGETYDPAVNDDGIQTQVLNKGNGWNGDFIIKLTVEETNAINSSAETYGSLGYHVVELSGVDDGKAEKKGIVTNDNNREIKYVEAVENGTVIIGSKGYDSDSDYSDNTFKVRNAPAYELPESGGEGTTLFTIGGLFLMSICLLYYGLSMRRKLERRKRRASRATHKYLR